MNPLIMLNAAATPEELMEGIHLFLEESRAMVNAIQEQHDTCVLTYSLQERLGLLKAALIRYSDKVKTKGGET